MQVVAHKTVYFRSKWARYDLAEPSTFRLVPPKERFAELEKDDEFMREMFFSPPPAMSDVLRRAGCTLEVRRIREPRTKTVEHPA